MAIVAEFCPRHGRDERIGTQSIGRPMPGQGRWPEQPLANAGGWRLLAVAGVESRAPGSRGSDGPLNGTRLFGRRIRRSIAYSHPAPKVDRAMPAGMRLPPRRIGGVRAANPEATNSRVDKAGVR